MPCWGGQIEPAQANAATYALNVAQRSLEAELLERRLEALEVRAETVQSKLKAVA